MKCVIIYFSVQRLNSVLAQYQEKYPPIGIRGVSFILDTLLNLYNHNPFNDYLIFSGVSWFIDFFLNCFQEAGLLAEGPAAPWLTDQR